VSEGGGGGGGWRPPSSSVFILCVALNKETPSKKKEKNYPQVLADPLVNGYFANTSMEAQRRKQLSFMMYAFGGPESYKGKDMFEAHKNMNLKEE